MPEVCIVCEKEKKGVPVKEDVVIRTIRSVKQKLGISTGYALVVCPDCVETQKKKRAEFEKRFVQHGAVALIIFILFILFFFSIKMVVVALFFSLFIMLLALLRYSSAVEGVEPEEKKEKKVNK